MFRHNERTVGADVLSEQSRTEISTIKCLLQKVHMEVEADLQNREEAVGQLREANRLMQVVSQAILQSETDFAPPTAVDHNKSTSHLKRAKLEHFYELSDARQTTKSISQTLPDLSASTQTALSESRYELPKTQTKRTKSKSTFIGRHASLPPQPRQRTKLEGHFGVPDIAPVIQASPSVGSVIASPISTSTLSSHPLTKRRLDQHPLSYSVGDVESSKEPIYPAMSAAKVNGEESIA
ncbi:hypothetical protein BV898_15720 [Hypsibius exemplaris]|uniref:Uncharacterized protein n=1 Tax=Hypsibius exemplaris TaxID=2072580 RepID=A0A9X6NEG5_HYPEX|nr:hypothetical protein BV898_15720 [Hypsibius exemplaris]